MASPKAEEFRRLYRAIVVELKRKFEYNLGFVLNCCDYFCWNLQKKSIEVSPEVLDKFAQLMTKLEILQKIDIARVNELRKESAKDKTQLQKNQRQIEQMKQLNELKQLFYFFPKLKMGRSEYIQDSLLLSQNDLLDQISEWRVHDQLFLDNSTMKRSIGQLVGEQRFWEEKLNKLIKVSSDIFKLSNQEYTSMLRVGFHGIQKKRYSGLVNKTRIKIKNFEDSKGEKYKLAESQKKNSLDLLVGTFPFSIENLTVQNQLTWSPVLHEEIYRRAGSSRFNFKPVVSGVKLEVPLQSIYCEKSLGNLQRHLVVLVHQHNGSYGDMKLYKCFLGLILPHIACMNIKTMNNGGNKCILEMAKDLANEIIHNVKKNPHIRKISFITFSSGGVIARAALPYLQSFQKNMCSFISLDAPHLGYEYDSGFFRNSGLAFWNGFKSDPVDLQLRMKDAKSKNESFLFKLATDDRLYWFKNIILFNCPQNVNMPCSSSLVQIDEELLRSKNQAVLEEMSQAIWKNIKNDAIVRVNVYPERNER